MAMPNTRPRAIPIASQTPTWLVAAPIAAPMPAPIAMPAPAPNPPDVFTRIGPLGAAVLMPRLAHSR